MDDKIVVVDDDPGTIYLIGRILHGVGQLSFATSGEKALQLVHDCAPDLILLDAELPGMSGFKVFDELRAASGVPDVPIIFITSHTEAGFEVSALNMGAADYIAKPFTATRLLARVKTHLRTKHTADELRRTASTDTLTGVSSRHFFDESLKREWLRGLRGCDPMALLLIDIDHFTLYGERYGRAKGENCLRRVAAAIQGIVRRPADLVARFGGDQFGVLLPQTSRRGAEYVAQRILDAIDALSISHENSPTAHHVTASVGMSCYDRDNEFWAGPPANFRFGDDLKKCRAANTLLLAADKALHSAKLAGHARVRWLDIPALESPSPIRDIAQPAGEEHHATWV